MNPVTRRVLAGLAGAAVAAALLWYGANVVYLDRRDALLEEVASHETSLANIRRTLEDASRVERELQAFADRTLGPDRETVDHRLRTRLNRLGEALRLKDVSVSTGRASAEESPAKREFRGSLRDEPDFTELEGSISASGTIEQVFALLDHLQAEPWPKHITTVRIDPKDNGERFDAMLRFTTLYLPGRAPSDDAAPEPLAASGDPQRYASLVALNPFRVPPPPPDPPAPKPAEDPKPGPAPPAAFPFHKWTITGVASGVGPDEVWLRHIDSGESRRLEPGQRVDALTFIEIRGDAAAFALEEQRFTVSVGRTLSERSPMDPNP